MKRLHEALLDAFPKRDDLEQMVRYGLDENLDAIAGGDTLAGTVFDLIEWAQAQGRIDDLLSAAREGSPGNAKLREFAEQISRPTAR